MGNNPWLDHVKKTRAMPKHKGKSYKEVLQAASMTWHKGGASKSMPGRKDGTTKATSKDFDRDGHRSHHAQGKSVKRTPYSRSK